MKLSLSIVIPTYNGLDLLKKHLPSVIEYSKDATIYIIDDGSKDKTQEWLTHKYPHVVYLKNEKNLGFSGSVNKGFLAAKTDLVLLLNNDVSLKKDTIKHLYKHFSQKSVFSVGALEKLPGKGQRGKSTGEFKRGLLIHSAAKKLSSGPSLWTFCASGMFRRKVWNKLGGLDTLYKPAYWEDVDLGYRAWKAGYECLFEPSAIVKHEAESTMSAVLKGKKATYAFKNQLLFFWKNITDPWLIGLHLLWTPYHLVVTSWRSGGAFLYGFLLALTQLDQLTNQLNQYPDKRSDKEIMHIIKSQT